MRCLNTLTGAADLPGGNPTAAAIRVVVSRYPCPVTATQTSAGTHRKEVGGFIVVGVLAVVIDFALFNVLMLEGWPVWAANAVALFVSMTFAFVGNYKWTFAHREIKSLWHAYGAFAGINLLAVAFIEVVVVAGGRLGTRPALVERRQGRCHRRGDRRSILRVQEMGLLLISPEATSQRSGLPGPEPLPEPGQPGTSEESPARTARIP